jgi:hypothetical protein
MSLAPLLPGARGALSVLRLLTVKNLCWGQDNNRVADFLPASQLYTTKTKFLVTRGHIPPLMGPP